jgi:teichuronic acid exporter
VMALNGAGVWSLIAGTILGQTVKTLGMNYYSPFPHLPDFSFKGMKQLLRFGGHFTSIQVVWMTVSQADTLICAKLLGKDALGFYSVGMHLASLPSQRISALVTQIAFPTFSRMQEDLPKVQESMLHGVRILSFVAFPILWGMSAMAPEIIETLLGDKWISSIFPLQVLTLMIPFRLVMNFIGTVTQSIGRPDILLRNVLFSLLIIPLALIIGAHWWGLHGLVLSWLIALPIVFLQAAISTVPIFDMRLRKIVASMLPAAFASLLTYATIAFARYALVLGEQSFVRLGVFLVIATLCYGMMSLVFNRQGVREVVDLVRSVVATR